MTRSDFTTSIIVDQTAAEVFNAIANVRGWWGKEIEGSTSKLNDEFVYTYEDIHKCKMKIIEVVPNEKIVWFVLDNYFKFTKDNHEWKGNKLVFEITEKEDKTQLQFTQVGLVPEYECFNICRDAWTTYIQGSLRNLIISGNGKPNSHGNPQTSNERILSEK